MVGIWWAGPCRAWLRCVASPPPLTDRSSLNLQINPLKSSAHPTGSRPPAPGPASWPACPPFHGAPLAQIGCTGRAPGHVMGLR